MEILRGTRRAKYYTTPVTFSAAETSVEPSLFQSLETFDHIYRSLCAMMYNFAPLSGHPGGSVSSGRIAAGILYHSLIYDISLPDRKDADILSYSAGHKALGLYAHWALRDEIMRLAMPELLPRDIKFRLRLEDLLGFRRNPTNNTPLFKKFGSKALDGHPSQATPYIRLTTGASGVGLCSSIGLGFAAADMYGSKSPVIHIIEGEGGLTPGRVSEALAAAGTASLMNVVLHIDWNQASIDSDKVCANGSVPGDYVQWNPAELCYLNDWNVILVNDGSDFRQIIAAQDMADRNSKYGVFTNNQPTAIVYKTVKGWKYGIEGKKSHGAGHALCSAGFHAAVTPLLKLNGKEIELCGEVQRCKGGADLAIVEECYWNALLMVRETLEKNSKLTTALADQILHSKKRLSEMNRSPVQGAPDVRKIYAAGQETPKELQLAPGSKATLRGELGKVLKYYNHVSGGALFTAAADLLGSTSLDDVGGEFGSGFYNSHSNPGSRTLSIGGICEDAMSGIMSGISAFGAHIGVCSSYGAFMAALGHIASRLHAIGAQARCEISGDPYNPFFLICAHAGVKTGEDGPTHADPQPLQLLQENFVKGTMITLTPWDPQEMWHLVSESLKKRPAVIAPFVTRPSEKVIDRAKLNLAPASAAIKGVYRLLEPEAGEPDVTLVLQGSEVAYAFAEETLPLLRKNNIRPLVYYVTSAELFDMLPEEEQEQIFPERASREALGISGFTLPTLYRWIQSNTGRKHSLYPFKKGHYLGSGKAESVMLEAGLDGTSQFKAIQEFVGEKRRKEAKAAVFKV